MPALIEARSEASAIVLNDNLFVFGGMNIVDNIGNYHPIRTIERLNLKALMSSSASLS